MENVTDKRLLYIEDIRAYLSMVAPVDIDNSFTPFRNQIKNYAEKNNLRVDIYDIFVNRDQIYKPYTRTLVDKNGTPVDEISKIDFFFEEDSNGNPLYWGWYTIRKKFDCAIDPRNVAHGIRLRCKNIQLGNDTNCRRFLPGKQDERFNDYYYGEIHTLSDQLIPDMDRNYLRVDDMRTEFEDIVKKKLYHKLKDLSNMASKYKSDYKKIETYVDKGKEIEEKKKKSQFTSQEEYQRETEKLDKLREEAEKSRANIEKKKAQLSADNSPLSGVIDATYNPNNLLSSVPNAIVAKEPHTNISNTNSKTATDSPQRDSYLRTSKPVYDKFDKQSREVIETVYKIIGDIMPDEEMKNLIINRIERELTK